jgi:hypothetical protein
MFIICYLKFKLNQRRLYKDEKENKKCNWNNRNSNHQFHDKEYALAHSRGLAEHVSWFW